MKKLAMSTMFLASLLLVGVASAEDGSTGKLVEGRTPATLRGVIDLPSIEITSPPMRPLATIDVARIEPRLTLFVLRQAFIGRIEETVFTDRF